MFHVMIDLLILSLTTSNKTLCQKLILIRDKKIKEACDESVHFHVEVYIFATLTSATQIKIFLFADEVVCCDLAADFN